MSPSSIWKACEGSAFQLGSGHCSFVTSCRPASAFRQPRHRVAIFLQRLPRARDAGRSLTTGLPPAITRSGSGRGPPKTHRHRAPCRRSRRRGPDDRHPGPRYRRGMPASIAPISCHQAPARRPSAHSYRASGRSIRLRPVVITLRAAMLAGAANIRAGAVPPAHRSGCWNRCRCRSGPWLARNISPLKMPSPRLPSVSGHRPATAPARASRVRLVVGHVRRVDQAPALVDPALSSSHCTGRAPSAGHAIVHFLGLLGGMDMHRHLREGRGHLAQLLGRDRAQRMRRDAEIARPAAIATISRERAISVTKRSVELRKRICPGLGAASPKPP